MGAIGRANGGAYDEDVRSGHIVTVFQFFTHLFLFECVAILVEFLVQEKIRELVVMVDDRLSIERYGNKK